MGFALEVNNLEKRYSAEMQALKGVSLKVKQGDFFALLGPNGAGKSTLISIVSSLVKKTAGEVFVFGKSIDTNFEEARRSLGIVPQEFNFNGFEKVQDILINQAGYYGIPRSRAEQAAEKYLKKLGLWEKREVMARFLSGGMKRRLMIARALVHEPELLVLDEPTAGVDIELRRSMWEFLQEVNADGKTIILTTHYLEEAEQLCKHVAILDAGRILQVGVMSEFLTQLKQETFILDLLQPRQAVPELAGYPVQLLEPQKLEITLNDGENLNALFAKLDEQNIAVTSMRNKANRLEELFVNLVRDSQQHS